VLAAIAFEGRRNVPEEDIARAIDVTAGSPYNPAAIDTARERIVAVFRSHGFGIGHREGERGHPRHRAPAWT